MFHKLRLKLTLINVTIIVILFLLLIIGTYVFAQNEITKRSDHFVRKVAAEIKTGMVVDIPNHKDGPQPPPGVFFVKTDPAGIVTFQSSNQPLSAKQLGELVGQTVGRAQEQGTIAFGNTRFSYLKSSLNNTTETLITFEDFEQPRSILNVLLTALIIVGCICLILSFFGSFFMADRAMVPIRKAWKQQKDFLADASHELRTPLAVIQANLDVVMDNQEETVASQHKWLSNIRQESAYMSELLNSLLFLARADSHQQMLDKKTFSLDTALNRASEPFDPVAAAKGISLGIVSSTPVHAYGDEARIKQVIGILLDNAIRHTQSGGEISLRLWKSDSAASLTVSDTGEGIEAEHLDKIFDRFYQADKSRSTGGVGLGLAIARWIVENHGGTISVASVPGSGTTFTVQLPLH